MKFVIRFTALLTFLALGACGGGSNDPAPPDSGGANPPPPPVVTAPTITTQPAAQSATEPATVTLAVVASGTAPFTYQWRSSTDGTTWTDIAGATAASYDTGATSVGMNGRYYSVVVTNSAGSATSASARLTVTAAPPTGGGGPSGEFPHAPNPMAVTVTSAESAVAGFDVVSTTSASVQVPGGAADIIVADGVTVTVGVPGNAFLEDQSLTVTPVTLGGAGGDPLPFQSVLGAFDLGSADETAPELQLRNGVRVTFSLTQAALDALGGQPVIFSARADGTQLHLEPVFRNPEGGWSTTILTTSSGHLGIFGIAALTSGQSTALTAAWPSYDDFQLEAAVAPAAYDLRKAAISAPAPAKSRVVSAASAGDTEDWAAQMRARIDAYYSDVVVPAMNAAQSRGADVGLIRDAIRTALTWERMRQLNGVQDELDASVAQDIRDLASRGFDKALQDCTANRSGGATVQALGMLRQLLLLGGDTNATEQSVFDTCGTPKYDLSIDWQQVLTEDTTLLNDDEKAGFAGRRQDRATTTGKMHVPPDASPELGAVTFERIYTNEVNCTDTSRAWYCVDTKETLTAQDPAPQVTPCGRGFYAGYTVTRWNTDARGDVTGPQLSLWFQNAYGCASSSFNVSTGQATDTIEYTRQARTTTATVGSSDSVDTTAWAGGARVGTFTRIVRHSTPLTGQNIQPGSILRWSTRLTITLSEVAGSN